MKNCVSRDLFFCYTKRISCTFVRLIPTLITILCGLLLPGLAHALPVDPSSISVLCSIMPCGASGGGAAGLNAYVMSTVVLALELLVVGVAVVFLFVAAAKMVAFSSEESTVTEAKTSYIYIIVGLAIVGLAHQFVLAFSPINTGANLVNTGIVSSAMDNVVTYFYYIIAVTLMVNIVIQAVRLINAEGQQEQTDKAKKRLIAGFIGAGIMLLSNIIVRSIAPGAGSSEIALQIAGIASYLIMIIGFLALLSIVLAGVLLIISIDEGLKDKAKNLIKTSIVALIVVLVSYALVTAFISI